MLSKKQSKEFLRICKNVDFIKFNRFLQNNKISQSVISRFISDDDYDMVSDKIVGYVSDELYNACLFIVDMYKECEKIA